MGAHRAQASAKSTFASRLGDLLLTILAAAGSLCLLLVILSFTLNISIMMFKTGSMSPTITAGSIALVKEIPASELNVGDVATVQRTHEELPVTHRVTEIKNIADDGTVTFTMKGDGNDTPDVEPYSASTVQRVFFSAPGLAPLIQKLNSPYVLGMLTLGAATLVVWAFWPREHDGKDAPPTGSVPSPQAILLPALLLAATTVFASTAPANASTPDSAGDHLRLASELSPAMSHMSPGESAKWTVDVWAEAPDPGMIDVDLHVGSMPDRPMPWTLSVVSCPVHDTWHQQGCGHDSNLVLTDIPARDIAGTTGRKLLSFHSTQRHRFLVTASLTASPSSEWNLDPLQVQIFAKGMGEEIATPPVPHEGPPDLADTGATNMTLLFIAAACAASGLAAATLRNWRKRG